MQKVLVTGGAGYIGSHTCLVLLEAGHEVVVLDNLCNSSEESLLRVEKLTGKKIKFYNADLMNKGAILEVLQQETGIDAVIHFAALKAVGESVAEPLKYYNNNISGTINLLECMQEQDINNIVFSSSATVYGNAKESPVSESAPLGPTNPYGQTKYMMEVILTDCAKAHDLNVTLLRYFNPVGAHESGKIGEDPEFPNNLLPFVQQVAAGIRPKVYIFGDDYDTPDGTGVRDYIHVMDLAEAHAAAISKMTGVKIYNVGTGTGYSVKEMIEAFRTISGQEIPVEISPRREGDVAELTAQAALIEKELGWTAKRDLNDMITDAWRWQKQNPKGFRA
jgi:UDP-glucose 4-epimerase